VIVWPELYELVKADTADFLTLQWRALAIFFALSWTEGSLAWLQSRRREPNAVRRTAKPTPELIVDLWYWLLTPAVRVIARFALLALLVGVALLLGREIGPSLYDGFGPLARQPLWLCTLELALLTDLASYWTHRLFHTVPWLWRFHAIHHSAKVIRWSTTARVHPINDLATYLVNTLPFFLLGFPLKAVVPLLPWVVLISVCAHTQWNLSFGWLGNVLVSPRFHRWHHTHSSEGGSSNFSNMFSFWDRLFGTRYYPKDRVAEVFGLDHDDVPESYLAHLAYPFRSSGAATTHERAMPERATPDPGALTASTSPARSLAPAAPPPGRR
jgi:sterol desaturase/sphingolipid hydroxylase (fatty acid hydroxylase superfamily)